MSKQFRKSTTLIKEGGSKRRKRMLIASDWVLWKEAGQENKPYTKSKRNAMAVPFED